MHEKNNRFYLPNKDGEDTRPGILLRVSRTKAEVKPITKDW